jgi:hypothetical protein
MCGQQADELAFAEAGQPSDLGRRQPGAAQSTSDHRQLAALIFHRLGEPVQLATAVRQIVDRAQRSFRISEQHPQQPVSGVLVRGRRGGWSGLPGAGRLLGVGRQLGGGPVTRFRYLSTRQSARYRRPTVGHVGRAGTGYLAQHRTGRAGFGWLGVDRRSRASGGRRSRAGVVQADGAGPLGISRPGRARAHRAGVR